MAFSLPIRWRGITRGSAASRDIFLISKISHIIRHYKFVLQGACIFLKEKLKRHVFFKLEQKTRRRKNLSFNRFFHKLDNNKWKIHTGARAREQKYISIYISLCMKTFLKTGVYMYTRFHLQWRIIWMILGVRKTAREAAELCGVTELIGQMSWHLKQLVKHFYWRSVLKNALSSKLTRKHLWPRVYSVFSETLPYRPWFYTKKLGETLICMTCSSWLW